MRGRDAASMTLEVLHRALVLLGRRARRKRAEVAAAAGLRVDFARIEAIAARLELADHRRLSRAACAPRMLRLAARLCALVAIVDLHRWFSTLVNRKERAKVPARLSREATPDSGAGSASALLAPNHNRRRSLTLLPARPLQIGDVILGLRKSETEVADELPVGGDIEDGCDGRRLEDRYPPHADAFGARREPDRVDRRHRRVLDHLRHGVTPEAVALRRRRIGEHRQMRRGVVQAGEFEPGIRGRSLLTLRREGSGVAAFEILPNGGATGGIVDNDEPPGLTEPHRGGKTRELDQALQCPTRQRIAPKASNVPAPNEQVAQACAEGIIEIHWRADSGALNPRFHAPSLNAVTKSPYRACPRQCTRRVGVGQDHPPIFAAATSRTMISPICSSAPRTSPVWPPICRTDNHASDPKVTAISAIAQMAAAGPSPTPSATMPISTAAVALARGGVPTPTERPSALAGGTNRMNTGMPARAAM